MSAKLTRYSARQCTISKWQTRGHPGAVQGTIQRELGSLEAWAELKEAWKRPAACWVTAGQFRVIRSKCCIAVPREHDNIEQFECCLSGQRRTREMPSALCVSVFVGQRVGRGP